MMMKNAAATDDEEKVEKKVLIKFNSGLMCLHLAGFVLQPIIDKK